MQWLENLSDKELEEEIDSINYILDFGVTMQKAVELNYQLNACLEVRRNRKYADKLQECPDWFIQVVNDNPKKK